MKNAIVFDSSCWIEVLTRGPLSKKCENELEKASIVFVPTLVLYEIYKKISLATTEDEAMSAVAMLSQNSVIDLTREIALAAADISISQKLAMADSLILAHAQNEDATLITLDNDFVGIPKVKVLR